VLTRTQPQSGGGSPGNEETRSQLDWSGSYHKGSAGAGQPRPLGLRFHAPATDETPSVSFLRTARVFFIGSGTATGKFQGANRSTRVSHASRDVGVGVWLCIGARQSCLDRQNTRGSPCVRSGTGNPGHDRRDPIFRVHCSIDRRPEQDYLSQRGSNRQQSGLARLRDGRAARGAQGLHGGHQGLSDKARLRWLPAARTGGLPGRRLSGAAARTAYLERVRFGTFVPGLILDSGQVRQERTLVAPCTRCCGRQTFASRTL
jgi:hypothetical protein